MILILTDKKSNRLSYTLDFIFKRVLGVEFEIKAYDKGFTANIPSIYYGKEIMPLSNHCIRMFNSGLLFQSDIKDQNIQCSKMPSGALGFFQHEGDNFDYEIDIFSLVFYLISRYEEYLTANADRYGRYEASQSLAFKNNFLEIPLVDIWIEVLKDKIKLFCPESLPLTPKFQVNPTVDIDQVWAYNHRGFRMIGGVLKDIFLFRTSLLMDRFTYFGDDKNDPFFTFQYLDSMFDKFKKTPKYFVLFAAKPNRLDINHSIKNNHFLKFIKAFSLDHQIGIHPSIQSHADLNVLKNEKKNLENVLKKNISNSRQHYIKFSLPETYRSLIEIGIKADYSMGYPDHIGYRAGTGHSFLWYDLLKEETTTIEIHPFEIMEVTLKKYMQLNPQQSIVKLKSMLDIAKTYNVPITFIWHNSSFSPQFGWSGWEKVFEFLLEYPQD